MTGPKREFSRTQRVEAQLARELTRLFREQVKDPRAALATVTGVKVTKDLRQARVFVSVLDLEHGPGDAVAALNQAAGFLRWTLGKELRLRRVPALAFEADTSAAYGSHMSQLIDEAVAEDHYRAGNDGTPDGGAR